MTLLHPVLMGRFAAATATTRRRLGSIGSDVTLGTATEAPGQSWILPHGDPSNR